MFQHNKDYAVPLLRVLADFDKGAVPVRRVYQAFDERYGSLIPPEHRGTRPNGTTIIWQHIIAWQRHELTNKLGLVALAGHGEWWITQAGRDWLAQHPDAQHIDLSGNRTSQRSNKVAKTTTKSAVIAAPPGITLEILEETRQSMPDEQFRRLWGGLYDQMVAAERARAISDVTEREIGRRAWQQVRTIHEFLQGRSDQMPSSEMLCDWIHICYQYELYREAAALWQMVQQSTVNPWYYERTQKLARTAQARRSR